MTKLGPWVGEVYVHGVRYRRETIDSHMECSMIRDRNPKVHWKLKTNDWKSQG